MSKEKKITATFQKQRWDGHNKTHDTDEVEFDATDIVLSMNLSDIHAIEDNTESSDAIGNKAINHDGPFYVYGLETSICEFFDVDCLDEITQEKLDAAVAEYKPKLYRVEKIMVTVELEVTFKEGVSINDVVNNADLHFGSNTPGASILHASIREVQHGQENSLTGSPSFS